MNEMELLNGAEDLNLDPELIGSIEAAVRAGMPNASPADRKTARRIAVNSAKKGSIKQPINAREAKALANLKRIDPGLYNDFAQGKLMARSAVLYVRDFLTGIETELGSSYSNAIRGRTNLVGRQTESNSLNLVYGVAFGYGAAANTETEVGNVQFVQQGIDAAFTPRIPAQIQNGEVEVQAGETKVIKTAVSELITQVPQGVAVNGPIIKELDSSILVKGGTQISMWVRGALGTTLPTNFGGFTPARHASGISLLCLELVRRS